MTKLFERAVETVQSLPAAAQDELARLLLVGEEQPVVQLTAEEEASLDESIQQTERGEFATDEEVRAIWAKYGL
jgi:predicted transcriptional regulator